MLAVWGYAANDEPVEDVTITGCSFNMELSEYNNPGHLITLAGPASDIVFENNTVYAEKVIFSVIKISDHISGSAEVGLDEVYIKDNTIVVDDVNTNATAVINGDNYSRVAVLEGNAITVNTKSGSKIHGVTGRHTFVDGNNFFGNGFYIITYDVRTVKNNTVEQCVDAFRGVLNCIGNVVDECTEHFIYFSNANVTGTPNNWASAVIKDNCFESSASAGGLFYTAQSQDLYCSIIFENNEINNGRFVFPNSYVEIEFTDNLFYLSSLGRFSVANGKITVFNGNGLYSLTGDPSISATAPPSNSNFNTAIPTGSFVGLTEENEYDPTVAGASPVGEVIGYCKNAVGASSSTWTTIYSQGA